MNEALRKELERYYLHNCYGDLRDSESVKSAHSACYASMGPLKRLDKKLFDSLEMAMCDSEIAHELQGFLRGYEHCLTMLGLNNEKPSCQ